MPGPGPFRLILYWKRISASGSSCIGQDLFGKTKGDRSIIDHSRRRNLDSRIMSTATNASFTQREPELLGQTVVVIGGSAGIGLETARRARAEGAKLILTGRNPEPLRRAAVELDALSTAAFDATDPAPLEQILRDLRARIDHVMLTAGRPTYGRLLDMDFEQGAQCPQRTPLAGAPRRPKRRSQDQTRRYAPVHGRTGSRRPGIDRRRLDSHGCAARPDSQPRA